MGFRVNVFSSLNIILMVLLKVNRSFKQKYGIDYLETFSPVVRYSSSRVILSICFRTCWTMLTLKKLELEEEMYINHPRVR